MQLLWLYIVLCAAVLSSTNARYAPKGPYLKRGLREFSKGPYNTKQTNQIPDRRVVLGAGVVPFRPEDIGEGIVPEVTDIVQFVPYVTTEKPGFSWDSIWNNVASAVDDIGNSLGDVASDVGDTVGNWGEEVGDTVGNWGENMGETLSDWGESVGNTVDDWGDTLADVADDITDKFEGVVDDAQVKVQEAQVALVEAAQIAGEKLKQTYQDAKEGLPKIRDQVLDSLRRFGLLVSDGAKYVFNKLSQITDQVHCSDIIQKLKDKLEQGDEQVAAFLQLIGHKMETWFESHNQLTKHLDTFQDPEVRAELEQLVEHGILTVNDVNILAETSRISDKLQKLMEHGDERVTDLVQLLTQKITKWGEENRDSISQVTQQVPSLFQDEDIQEELNNLVELGILTESDIKMLVESTSVVNKLQDAVVREDERVMQIFNIIAEREVELQNQQDQRNVEMLPDIFQDDEVQDELQNLVDAGTLTQDDFFVFTQQQNQQGHIIVEKRMNNRRGWFDTVTDWGNEYVDNAADQFVDDAVGKRKRMYASLGLFDSVGDTFDDWGDSFNKWGDSFNVWGDGLSEWGDIFNDWGDTARNIG